MQELHKKKEHLITILAKEYRSTPAGHAFMGLLDVLINECRIQNDTLEPHLIPYSQGKIAAYKSLQDYFVKGLPSFEQSNKK